MQVCEGVQYENYNSYLAGEFMHTLLLLHLEVAT